MKEKIRLTYNLQNHEVILFVVSEKNKPITIYWDLDDDSFS